MTGVDEGVGNFIGLMTERKNTAEQKKLLSGTLGIFPFVGQKNHDKQVFL